MIIGGIWLWRSDNSSDKDQKAGVSVIVVPAAMKSIAKSIDAIGTLQANESIRLTSNVSETVNKVNFTDGMHVSSGDVIVELEHSEEKADLIEAESNVTRQQQEFARVTKLVKEKAAAHSRLDDQDAALKQALAQRDAAKARIADRVIVAPFSGTLGLRMVSPGTLVQPGTAITTLDDTSILKLDFTVPEANMSALRPDLEIVALTPAFPNEEFKGKVIAVDSRVDQATRMITVRAQLPNTDDKLRPGMLMNVKLNTPEHERLVIPEEALVSQQDLKFVYVIDANNKAIRKEVSLGQRRPGEVEILNGLQAGERVVTEGTMLLQPGMNVTIVEPAPETPQKEQKPSE